MNKVLLGFVSFAVVLAAPVATSNQSLAQSSTPVSTETIEKWNTELRDQIRRLEAEKEGVELRQRARRLQAEKENAELHERVRRLQSDLSSAQSPAPQQPAPQPQHAAPASSPQPERAAARSSPQPQRTPPAERKPSRPDETELSSAQSPAPQQPQRTAPVSSPQPQRAAAERKPSRPHETEARRESPRQAAVEQQSPASNALFPWYPSWSSQPAAPAAAVPAPAVPAAALPAAALPAAALPAAAVPAQSQAVVVHGTIDLNSSPEGALAQTSLGAGCETPCAMEVSTDRPFSVTFKQRGYTPSTVNIQIQRAQPGVADPKFSPNPVFVQLTPSRTR